MWIIRSNISDMVKFKSEIEARRWMELLLYAGELVTLRKEGEKIFNDPI